MNEQPSGDSEEAAWFRWVYLASPWYAVDGTGATAQRHADLWFDTVAALDGADRWLHWWEAHGPRRYCALFPHFQDAAFAAQLAAMTAEERRTFEPRSGVTRSKDEFRVWLRFDADWTSVSPDLASFVQAQVETAMEHARLAARMPPPPSPPWGQDG